MRLVLLAAAAAASCWPDAETDAPRKLFWLHAPKTGSSLREFLVDYSCGLPPRYDGQRSATAADLALARRLERCARNACAPRPFDEKSYKYHKSFYPKHQRDMQQARRDGVDAPAAVFDEECAYAGVAMLREPRARLASAFFMKGRDFANKVRQSYTTCMGISSHASLDKMLGARLCERLRALPAAQGLTEYAKRLEVRNVQTKMILGIYRYAARPDDSLDVEEAIRRLKTCFPFIGLQERWGESLWLFSQTMRGAAPFNEEQAAVNTRLGSYDRGNVKYLSHYADQDTKLYAAAVQLHAERLTAARRGESCN